MEHQATPPETRHLEPPRRPSLPVAEHIALEALGPYDAALPPPPKPRPIPPREDIEDGRLLRLALLPLASWCLGVLFGLATCEMVCAVIVAGLVAGALALRR